LRKRIVELKAAFVREKAARNAEAAMMTEMLARIGAAEAAMKTAQAAADAANARARVAEARARELQDREQLLSDRLREVDAEALRLKSVRPLPQTPSSPGKRRAPRVTPAPSTMRGADIAAGRALQQRLAALEELCAGAAALFEELERRETAIAEFRAQALTQARRVLLRSIGREGARPAKPDRRG
jgi:hypothetical protein